MPSRSADSTTGSPSRICTSVVESNTTIVPSSKASCSSKPTSDTSMLRVRPLGNSVTLTMPDCERVTTSVGANDVRASGTATVHSAHAGTSPATIGARAIGAWPGSGDTWASRVRTLVGGIVAGVVVVGTVSPTVVDGDVGSGSISDSPPSRSSAPAEPTSSAITTPPATTLRPTFDLGPPASALWSSKSSGGGSSAPLFQPGADGAAGGRRPVPNTAASGAVLSGTQSSRVHGDVSSGSSSATAPFDHMPARIPSRR